MLLGGIERDCGTKRVEKILSNFNEIFKTLKINES